MDTLSIVYKVVAAVSVFTGIVSFVLDARGITLSQIPPQYLKPAGTALIFVAVFFGVVDYLTGNPMRSSEVGAATKSSSVVTGTQNLGIQINPSGGNVSIGEIKQTIIQPGDPPEVKQQKLKRAQRLIAEEILSDIAAIDSRLGYVSAAIAPDQFEAKLRDARSRVAPSTSEPAAAGYRHLIAAANVASLRQAINSSPLRSDLSRTLVQMLIDAGVEVRTVRYFYDQLGEVQWATESLFNALAESTNESQRTETTWREYYANRVDLAVQTLKQRSESAHLAGLSALHTLGVAPSEAKSELASLKHLNPRELADHTTLQLLLTQNDAQFENLVLRKKALQEKGEGLLEKDLKKFGEVNALLVVKPTDKWNEVVGKAVSLRQLGRITEAMAAFHNYGQMFAGTDSTATGYANTAMTFTQQIKSLGLTGGVYVFQVLPNGAAGEAGMTLGDVIIEYDGKAITGMNDIAAVLSGSREGELKRFSYLRLDPKTGRFAHHTGVIKGGPLGAGIMPI